MGIQEQPDTGGPAGLDGDLAGQTICTALAETAERHGARPAYSERDGGAWATLTWAETRTRALETAAGFAALGLEPGDVVALMMPNRTEHVLADLGAVHAGGTPTTLYATLAPDQVAFIAGHCSAKYAVLDGKDQLDRWLPVLDRLPRPPLRHLLPAVRPHRRPRPQLLPAGPARPPASTSAPTRPS